MIWIRRIPLTLALLAATSCNLPSRAPAPQPVSPQLAATASPASAPPITSALPEHRIGVRTTNGQPEFFDRQTGAKFVPRGANLWRWKLWPRGNEKILIDTMFNTKIGQLDSALQELPRMHAEGFNVVRVWENACWGGAPGCMDLASGGLDPAYLKNLARFIQTAKDNGLYVLLTVDELPDTGGYRDHFTSDGRHYGGFNRLFLTQGGIDATRLYYTDFIRGLHAAGAPTDAILAYELHNEAFYEGDALPLSTSSGSVTPANGHTYDLADPAQRRALMEDSWVYYIDQVSQGIKAEDPTALVTMGFFVQTEPNPARQGDHRIVYMHKVLNDSVLDFVDLHAYPGYELDMRQHAENFDILGYNKKPLLMGEFGADRHIFTDAMSAASRLQTWQAESCQYGFDGWLMWTWGGAEMPDDYWQAIDADGAIAHALSPNRHPDPCAVPNLALNKSVQVSAAMPDAAGVLAVDGNPETIWSSGLDAPQWIQIDLGQPVSIASIRLTVSQFPEGPTTHQVWVGADPNMLKLVHQFSGFTKDPEVLTFSPASNLNGVRFVRILTQASPSWVAWREIEVLGP
ncbi:MAG TPA: cellulase family glycosylhydrolase [Anaerolineales bacterium]|nr:cellulase family glycosylhydrolase [Anaerolineales bacterium]